MGKLSWDHEIQGNLLEKEGVKTPRLYRVILHNDDYTTMDFVIDVLMTIFHHSMESAEKVMMDVHLKGRGIVGIYPRDIAATKVKQVHKKAKSAGFPLRASYESV